MDCKYFGDLHRKYLCGFSYLVKLIGNNLVTHIWLCWFKSVWFPKHVFCLSDKSLQDWYNLYENQKSDNEKEKLHFDPLDEIPPVAKNWELVIQ